MTRNQTKGRGEDLFCGTAAAESAPLPRAGEDHGDQERQYLKTLRSLLTELESQVVLPQGKEYSDEKPTSAGFP